MNAIKEFKNPSAKYRGKPFWAWNGKLDVEEVRRQMRVFKQMGLGGGFMHSRVGLATPYLSQEWFDVINGCVAEAREQKMEAWLYDEDRWPSGAAGGLVTQHEQFRMRYLKLSVYTPGTVKLSGKELGVFLAEVDGTSVKNVQRADKRSVKKAPKNLRVFVFSCEIDRPSPWFNNQTYLDTMSKEAVAAFISNTHDTYAGRNSSDFGDSIPGIFTDEPNYGGHSFNNNSGRVPWTDAVPDVFQQRYGYNLLNALPELFFNIDSTSFSKVRRDYHDCITYLFVQHYAKQIYEWCEQHGLQSTGHVLMEETLTSQTNVVGSAMRFYEYMQAPGIDILCGEILSRAGGKAPEYMTAKQCCSVLSQFGRTWMLSELYGCTGWHLTLAEHKAVGDWQAALGVNLRCPHLAFYTMLGQAKRDYPASISYQSPWWRDYHVVEDYFSRVNLLMTQGAAVRDVAVIHPIESAWAAFVPGERPTAEKINEQLETVQKILLEEHFDFDYVDEDILARHGKVVKNMLRVAKCSYRTVVVPPMLTMRESTLKFLTAFKKGGGTVVFVDPVCPRINAEICAKVIDLASQCICVPLARTDIVQALAAVKELRRISITTSTGRQYHPVLYMLRHDSRSGCWYVFITHSRQDTDSGELQIELPCAGQVQEWDARSGEVFRVKADRKRNSVKFTTSLPPCGSRLFVVNPAADRLLRCRPAYHEIRRTSLVRKKWGVMRDEPNAFPLDRPAVSLNGEGFQEPEEILKVDRVVRLKMGLEPRGGRMVQPWVRQAQVSDARLPLILRFSFEVQSLPAGPCHLVIETPARFTICLNGTSLSADNETGWWIDKSFRKLLVAPWMLKLGLNELELSIDYCAEDGLEALYFTGEFGFKWRGITPVITALPQEISCGNWVSKGFACYSGALTYATTFSPKPKPGERVFIELPDWQGTIAKIRVNGVLAAALPWAPYEADVTSLLHAGKNTLEIEIVSSRRNLLGPLHFTNKYPAWTGSSEFVTSDKNWTDKYISVPYGMMKAPVLSFRTKKTG